MEGETIQVEELVSQFRIEGRVNTIEAFGSGHINDTFRLVNSEADAPDYLLQRVNHHVFPDVGPMMENIRKVTEHLKKKPAYGYESMTIVPAAGGKLYVRDKAGNYWRVLVFLKDLLSYDVAETPEQIYEGAKAFGAFMRALSDFPAGDLFPTLPNFHHVPWRVGKLKAAVAADAVKRVRSAEALIGYALEIAPEMSRIQQLGDAGKIPLRVTHNDTKFNNVLLDQAGRGRCVIDLDTVMPGFVHFDFGDGVRTSVSEAREDEADLQLIEVELLRFQAYAEGFLEASRDTLTDIELEYLPLSGAMLAYLMGIRFLTDYLQGDVYYKIHAPEHNLQRARAQLDLCRKLLARQEDLKRYCR